ncbi:MAG: hypothetical protein V3573_02830 [Desulfovibrionaceae bacterium]
MEKTLVRDVLGWYRKAFDLPALSLGPGQPVFEEPPLDDSLDEEPLEGFRLTPGKVRKAVLHSLLGGLLVSLGVLAWGGWFGLANVLFLAFMSALVYFLPVLLCLGRNSVMVIRYGPHAEQDLVREVALAYFNRNPVREAVHALLDALLWPLALSLQEGLAHWFVREYFLAGERPGFSPRRVPLRARPTCLLIRLGTRLFGCKLPRLLLLYA